MIDHVNVFDGLDSIIWVIEVLGRLIEHMKVILILKLFCLLMNLITKFKILVKTSSGWTSSRISRSLSLSFDTLDNFASLGVDSTEWIHAAILLMRMQDVVSHTRLYDSLLCLISWVIASVVVSHHLTRWSMLHILLLTSINIRCNVLSRSYLNHDLLMASDISRMFRSLAAFLSNLVKFLLNVLLCHLVSL